MLAAAAQAEDAQPALVRAAQAEFARTAELLAQRAPARQRAVVDSYRQIEFPSSPTQIARAARTRRPGEVPASPLSCPQAHGLLPLDVWFANYTLDESGAPIPGSIGWTRPERARLARFLCRMLPLVRRRYGPPFERWRITLVKDLYYSASWIFLPSSLEIHGSADWNPRLLTHEFVHAFRGRRGLTSNASWSYDPTLSGFEEGFAEGVAYLAMNDYGACHCPSGDCAAVDVPSYTLWDSYLEGTYDFSNDESMATTQFWTDAGGTLKFYERYLMAAAAIMRLEAAVPGFSRLFNAAYYARVREDPAYRPSRDNVIEIVETLAPTLDGLPARAWVERQRIFDCALARGKRIWTELLTPWARLDQTEMRYLRLLETFPDGSEWAQYVPGCPLVPGATAPYLYFRLRGAKGRLELLDWESQSVDVQRVRVDVPAWALDYVVRGCNEVAGAVAGADLLFLSAGDECAPYAHPDPVCFARPPGLGLHELTAHWTNPHYGAAPGPPAFGMPYDALQAQIAQAFPVLAGQPAGLDPDAPTWAVSVRGGGPGSLTITHSARPGQVSVSSANGTFVVSPPACTAWPPDERCWIGPATPWDESVVSVPGTLRFSYTPLDSSQPTLVEERTIVFGAGDGSHRFLIGGR